MSQADWARPALVLIAIELAAAFMLSRWSGIEAVPPIHAYSWLFAKLLPLILLIGLFVETIRLRAAPVLTSAVAAELFRNRQRLAWLAIGLGLFAMQFLALSWTKPQIPALTGFWADPMLADLDRAIFGADPWRALHAIAGSQSDVIAIGYSAWFVVIATVFALVLMADNNSARTKLLLAFFILFAIDLVFQFALPSAGPIFYRLIGLGDRFAELEAGISPEARMTYEYLWNAYLRPGSGGIGGISAMPSMHVALSAWACFVARSLAPKMLPLAYAFLAFILFGSVYLGWHYSSDGVVGAAMAIVSVNLARRWVDRSASVRARPALA